MLAVFVQELTNKDNNLYNKYPRTTSDTSPLVIGTQMCPDSMGT